MRRVRDAQKWNSLPPPPSNNRADESSETTNIHFVHLRLLNHIKKAHIVVSLVEFGGTVVPPSIATDR